MHEHAGTLSCKFICNPWEHSWSTVLCWSRMFSQTTQSPSLTNLSPTCNRLLLFLIIVLKQQQRSQHCDSKETLEREQSCKLNWRRDGEGAYVVLYKDQMVPEKHMTEKWGDGEIWREECLSDWPTRRLPGANTTGYSTWEKRGRYRGQSRQRRMSWRTQG